jgi:hypothetical protein
MFFAVFISVKNNEQVKYDLLTGNLIHPVYSGFALPIETFAAIPNIVFTSLAEQRTITIATKDDIVYTTAYLSTDGKTWRPITLTGQKYRNYNNWINGSAAGTINVNPSTFNLSLAKTASTKNYLITYSCTRLSNKWDCHSDTWQIKQFNVSLNIAQTTEPGTLPGATPVCTANSVAATCQGATCGTRTNNCGTLVSCGTCISSQTCTNGICVNNQVTCTNHTISACDYGDVYWFNSCGIRQEIRFNCNSSQTCNNSQCINPLVCTGSANQSCAIANGIGTQTRTCNSGAWGAPYGACAIVSCNNNYANCDANNANGCEVTLGTNAHCSSCTNICNSSQTCTNNICMNDAQGAATYYVATNGNDNNPGTITQPFASWQKGFSTARAGDLVYIRGGVYYPDASRSYGVYINNKSGTANNVIKIFAYPGERPILDASLLTVATTNNYGIELKNSNYWHLKGLEVIGASQHAKPMWTAGIVIDSGNNNILEQLKSHDNQGVGLAIRAASENNLVLNSDFYNNYDPYTTRPGDDADGMEIAFIDARTDNPRTNTIRGCRSWNNSDDGYDLWSNDGVVIIEGSVAYSNGYALGNGQGFKMGKTRQSFSNTCRILQNNMAFDNKVGGFDQSSTNCPMTFYNNIAYNNQRGWLLYEYDRAHILRNNIIYGNTNYFVGTSLIQDHNSWNGAVTVTNDDFISVNSAEIKGARKQDGSLPDSNFLKLKQGSDLINAGVDVGLPFYGIAPDLGPYESSSTGAQSSGPATYYVATNGNNNNPGTITQPFATWKKAIDLAQPGDLIYIRGGTYYGSALTSDSFGMTSVAIHDKHGTSTNPIKIWAYPGEKPILDFTGLTYNGRVIGFYLKDCSYLHLKGLSFTGGTQESHGIVVLAFTVDGTSDSTFENIESYNNDGPGMYMMGTSEDNLILNSDFHDNYDPYTPGSPGGNADGLDISRITERAGNERVNTIRGCRAWGNSDDGFDFVMNPGYVYVDNCWSFSNGINQGNGGGFKLGENDGTAEGSSQRIVSNSIAYNNKQAGFNQNEANIQMTLYNNIAANNGWGGSGLAGGLYFCYNNVNIVLRNNIGYNNQGGYGNACLLSNAVHDHNTWDSSVTVTDADFVSVDGSQLLRSRKSDGSLPDITFMKLAAGSDLIDAGVNVGLPYSGNAPDIGAGETN